MKWQSKLDNTWGNDGLFCGAIRRSRALGTQSSTGFHIPTQHLCHQCFPAPPVLEQFLTFCSTHTSSSFQAPQAVLHSPIIFSLHSCLSRTNNAFLQRPGCLFHDMSICLSPCTSSPQLPNSPQGWSGVHTVLWVCFSFLSLVSRGWGFPQVPPWPCDDALAQGIL